jgi:hypothetical protein
VEHKGEDSAKIDQIPDSNYTKFRAFRIWSRKGEKVFTAEKFIYKNQTTRGAARKEANPARSSVRSTCISQKYVKGKNVQSGVYTKHYLLKSRIRKRVKTFGAE